jgi:hypothetical protein
VQSLALTSAQHWSMRHSGGRPGDVKTVGYALWDLDPGNRLIGEAFGIDNMAFRGVGCLIVDKTDDVAGRAGELVSDHQLY